MTPNLTPAEIAEAQKEMREVIEAYAHLKSPLDHVRRTLLLARYARHLEAQAWRRGRLKNGEWPVTR